MFRRSTTVDTFTNLCCQIVLQNKQKICNKEQQMLRFYEFNLPRFEPSLCPADNVLHILDFIIVTSLLLSDPMVAALECGYIGLDIVD